MTVFFDETYQIYRDGARHTEHYCRQFYLVDYYWQTAGGEIGAGQAPQTYRLGCPSGR